MDNSPLISIIVVSYNQEKYIRENLDSIKRQTYANIELIIADDASKDNSVEVFEKWLIENNYIAKKNYHQNNTGFATTLNECIELTTGKYIKIIAADDFLHENAIEKCVSRLEELGEDYGMIYTDVYTIDEDSKIREDMMDCNSSYHPDPDEFYNMLVLGNRIMALSVVVLKSVLVETGIYDEKFLVEDYYKWLKIGKLYKVAYIPEKLAFYRWHGSNISIIKAERIKKEDIILKMMFDKTGIAKNIIRDYLIVELIKKNKVDIEALNAYKKYPYRNKLLIACTRYNFPSFGYRVLNRLIKLGD
ncbi:glycosyltransferase family 2 protein [Elizabethkingia meningoseptica]|uniref:glycosyltransferase family 2 protein n=1 Tax=Elizabethkingia meningoseptica TaxID=238 RepID=UPI0023AEFA38|nr:glycosyltransferase family 2 protein [Elizabethkingia meningoseptica]MDE5438542.1 glycosyltransferase family 2 protein [Elizabethkingia meningoseptica]MDE5507613.1 glycosyltransferase family 2 protein [Elizabethkingia meningoseptica]MDE5526782.1 glycosyltransferase family 2 protein [Elizabethkingia meningoseptica]MDE5530788.1 glycosyltransferase family 2 protein [Elizabethkingia meningoseptica]MDE5534345.1 glycosyltransferase family 2 protein [Elizabethkingia meningoseptica]